MLEKPEHSETPFVKEPFPATLTGLESAKFYIGRMMNLIVKEVDFITKEPGLASDDRELPCQCPLILKQYLPVSGFMKLITRY